MSKKKTNGVYYTPKYLAKFIVKYLENNIKLSDTASVLEPSCGDGVFIKSLLESSILDNIKQIKLFIVEKDEEELKKTIKLLDGNNKIIVSSNNEDYLDFHCNNLEKFDLIIGNPPYIKREYLSEEQIEKCTKIQNIVSEKNNNVKNIWISFVISAISKLKDDGCLCFVLPGEILQVKYAQDLRNILIRDFEKIEIFHFNQLIFELVEQDVIIIFAYKKSKDKGLYHCSIKNIEDIRKKSETKIKRIKYSGEFQKWTGYVLTEKELNKIHSLGSKFNKINYYCESSAGIVTAANNYFIINKETEEKYKLNQVTKPIIQKSYLVPNCINFTHKDYEDIVSKNSPSKLIYFDKNEVEELSESEREYIQIGIDKKFNERFKCKQRKPWYKVKSVWKSEGIFFKRSHIYPKIVYNDADVLVTDSGYRIIMKEKFDILSLIFCFYNSLTLVFCELMGRAYGGGVLELTPNEFKGLPIPYYKISKSNFAKLDKMLREKQDIKRILKFTDKVVLESKVGLDERTILELQVVYEKLIMSRLRNGKDK